MTLADLLPSNQSYNNINARPMYFDRLSEEDQEVYQNMQHLFSIKSYSFSEILQMIHNFCTSSTSERSNMYRQINMSHQESSSASSEPLEIPNNDNSYCYSCGYGYAGYNNEFNSYAKAAERASSVKMLVCGVCWIHPGFSIALNFKQLRVLIGQGDQKLTKSCKGSSISTFFSKSNISSSLQRLGYVKVPSSSTPIFLQSQQQQNDSDSLHNYSTELIVKLQLSHPEPSFIREWSFFQMAPSTPEPQRPTFNISNKNSLSFSSMSSSSSTTSPEAVQQAAAELSSISTRASFPSLTLFNTEPINSNCFMSPQPQEVAPVDLEEAKESTKKFECLRDDFFFNDPFCLPPAFMFDEMY